jgi:L-fuculose-phosphate aldolase
MMLCEEQAKVEVIAAGKELTQRGLVARTWGNVSCRIDEKHFAITPSGIAYERLSPETIVVVDIDSLEYQGDVKPSSEKGIHAAAYRLNPSVNFVIHTHQTYATCLSVAGFEAIEPTAAEKAVLGGAITLAEYGLPGTKKLRKNVEKALSQNSSAVLMAHHGALITGSNRAEAFERSVTLETVCQRSTYPVTLSDGTPAPNTPEAEALYIALYRAYPEFKIIMRLSSEAVTKVMEKRKIIPAVLDDFAQMGGMDVKVCPELPSVCSAEMPRAADAVVRAIRGRNCVCVEGLGAVCCAANESDCTALLSLVEKNALACVNASSMRPVPTLSWLDRKLMRFVYLTKYSKKK